MPKSFNTLKDELDEACAELRKFTLAQPGVTQKFGVEKMELVHKLCDKMSDLYGSGANAGKTTVLVNAARTRVRAAQARLNLLRGTRTAIHI